MAVNHMRLKLIGSEGVDDPDAVVECDALEEVAGFVETLFRFG